MPTVPGTLNEDMSPLPPRRLNEESDPDPGLFNQGEGSTAAVAFIRTSTPPRSFNEVLVPNPGLFNLGEGPTVDVSESAPRVSTPPRRFNEVLGPDPGPSNQGEGPTGLTGAAPHSPHDADLEEVEEYPLSYPRSTANFPHTISRVPHFTERAIRGMTN
jgi:hypothetical protein